MSDDAKLRTAAGLSKLWDDGETRRVRVGDGATMLPGRRLTVHLMVQPDVAGIMLNDRLLANLEQFINTAHGFGRDRRFGKLRQIEELPSPVTPTRDFNDWPSGLR